LAIVDAVELNPWSWSDATEVESSMPGFDGDADPAESEGKGGCEQQQ
jgi:hypothetical protein